jgi:hypothetical protein
MLAARLKALEAGGVLERATLPPPAAARIYRLTAYGEALRPALRELAAWGARSLGPPTDEFGPEPGWLARALDTITAGAAPGGRFEFRIDEEVASIVDGDVGNGSAADADAIVTGTAAGFYHLYVDGDWSGIEVEGDREAVERLVAGTSRPPTPVAA